MYSTVLHCEKVTRSKVVEILEATVEKMNATLDEAEITYQQYGDCKKWHELWHKVEGAEMFLEAITDFVDCEIKFGDDCKYHLNNYRGNVMEVA